MSAHTPGPWRVYEDDPFVVVAGAGFSICGCEPGNPLDVSSDAAVANAKLIAAAPKLLEELEKAAAKLERASSCVQKWMTVFDVTDPALVPLFISDIGFFHKASVEARAAIKEATS